MNIILTGERKEIHFLIKSFTSKGHQVTYINKNEEYCRNISRKYENITVVLGDPSNPKILEEAHIFLGDILIALENYDSDNLIICQTAKKIFKIEKTLAVVNDPSNIEIFKKLGVDAVISTTDIISSIIEQKISAREIENIINVGEGKASISELSIGDDNPIINKSLSEIRIPNSAVIGCILRDGKAIIPRGETKIFANDKLIVISLQDSQSEVFNLLKGRD